MMHHAPRTIIALAAAIALLPALVGFSQPVNLSAVKAGEFDNGKMWTFDYPPIAHLERFYGFTPDEAWFEKARLGALRLPGCSASFVSPHGLVMTNHHCGRGSVARVTREGETLLDDGFMAISLEEERPVPGLYVDQLVAITDVTDEIYTALEGQETDAEKANARQEAITAAQERILEKAGGPDAGFVVQIVNLYNGGRYSAYTFRRYGDLRLVMAPELNIGYFGGDTDNFTYPRYALDMTFFRVYENDEPYQPEHYFAWSENGTKEGDAVFIIGNPGSTLRLNTVAQLEWRRDHQEKDLLALLDSRIAVLEEYNREEPSDALRNQIFGLKNGQKLYHGRVKGLNDPVLMAKRADTENTFLRDMSAKYGDQISTDVPVPYLTVIEDLARIQDQKREYAREYGAFLAMGTGSSLSSATVRRAVNAYDFLKQEAQGVDAEALDATRQELLALRGQPSGIDSRFLLARINDLVKYFGQADPAVQQMLGGRSPEEVADNIIANSALADEERFARALEDGSLSMEDPAIAMVAPFMERRQAYQSAFAGLAGQETELNAQHGRARFEVYGTTRPPDATFSLRVADGQVKAYEYNGSKAPAYTTFYGMYNRHYSHASGNDTTGEWILPERWLNAPLELDRSTPMNFVSTVDIIGGNSGSPVLNKDLEVVGLAFDGNIEFLPSAFIFDAAEAGRTVSVDSRGMMEALDVVYDMDRLVLELQTGQLAPTEEAADALRAG
jgi:hypothetical protein